jgi:L-ascorbate metabolism protein UlaG (beta-lactamase superfamily)
LPPTALLVCINGKLGNMTAAEAARLAAALRPRVAIPMHYGMFADNTADPQEFVRLAQAHAPQSAVVLLALGEPFLLRA